MADYMRTAPAADRLRPTTFDDMSGQKHLVGERGVLRRLASSGRIPSMIFFGPPGTGKTTAASIIAASSGMTLRHLNATTASLADVRAVAAETEGLLGAGGILLYLDEIQYFNRKQQQSLLEYVEDGRITLIAATTENPYYYVYDALLSRCSVFEFKPVTASDMMPRLRRAAEMLSEESSHPVSCEEEALAYIASVSGGDVRRGVTMLEQAIAYVAAGDESENVLTRDIARQFVPSISAGNFDGDGDVHYDLLSCLQKSIRGSDPDATAFYVAKLVAAGELLALCRRLQVIASEDIGLAYPQAAMITRAYCQSAVALGLPEGRIPLINAALLLATSPKSNSAYLALDAASQDIDAGKGNVVPTHLQSPLFKGYRYPHDYPDHYVTQQYLPDDLKNARYYNPTPNKQEMAAAAYWEGVHERAKKK